MQFYVLNEHIDPKQGRVYKGQIVDVENEKIQEKKDRLMIGEPVKKEIEKAVKGEHEKAVSTQNDNRTNRGTSRRNRSKTTLKD